MTVTVLSYQDGMASIASVAGNITGYWMDKTKPERKTYSVEINIPSTYRFCDFHPVQGQIDAIVKNAEGHSVIGKVTAYEEGIVFLSISNDLIMIEVVPDHRFYAFVGQYVSLLVHKIELFRTD